MREALPVSDIEWMTKDEIACLNIDDVPDDAPTGYILEDNFQDDIKDDAKDNVVPGRAIERVAYELMQTRHPDASLRATSLDVEYFYAYNSFPPMRALYGNRPASGKELGWPGAGVLIKRPGHGWALDEALFKKYNDGFNPGRLLSAPKISKSKQYPRFKTTQTYLVKNFKAFTAPLP
ncbi:hypothetical protein HPB47_019384 [Ixodes persulcatus]|uniref:Uncharacterized protein n=1 Tax=Ixodes persulcatus TaxID=34615 RepID=A0AC60R3U4_IXOPE|nr:hypothetical protein HPB47_019384 [Ixodes persulcatus]